MEIEKIKDIKEYLAALKKNSVSELSEEDIIKWVINARKAGLGNYETLSTILAPGNSSYVSKQLKKQCFSLMRQVLETGQEVLCGIYLGNEDGSEQPKDRYYLSIF